jgi:hypothetical protein
MSTKQEDELKRILTVLKNAFLHKEFSYLEITKLMGTALYTFYDLLYAGVITKAGNGKFRLVQGMNLTPEEIHQKSKEYVRERTKRKKEQKALTSSAAPVPVNNPVLFISEKSDPNELPLNNSIAMLESEAIAFLKNLGYKIYKPEQKFTEV